MLKLHPQQLALRIAQKPGFIDWYINDFMPEHLPEHHQAIDSDSLNSTTTS